ncbi:uncharacterized protein QC763_0102150 [Podospora pseudopauciseta]|uniref:Protein kinase domain-containing protein n=1 Tax=Podospora pseudopauciseta TaxID=2093780 RepID=A0ABR0GZZ3_9PEZI|nr:hypothetical protein QC763_0102150 [Podospora pseudopauciseta]
MKHWNLSPSQAQFYGNQVCQPQFHDGKCSESGYRKIFAVLVMMRRSGDIVGFVEQKICDGHLPLEAVVLDDVQLEVRLQGKTNKKLDFLSHWDEDLRHEDFERLQWMMLPPSFVKERGKPARLYELPKKVIMPWLSEERGYDGGYSWVTKVQIHPQHYDFKEFESHIISDNTFAVKHLKHLKVPSADDASNPSRSIFTSKTGKTELPETVMSTSGTYSLDNLDIKKEFEHEIEILNRLSCNPHPHLITLLAAYQLGDECCMIFPWADCDLQSMWATMPNPSPALAKSNLQWVLSQCLGLAQGLHQIHQSKPTPTPGGMTPGIAETTVYGRHGDIKPKNILYFANKKDPGKRGGLVITDFGLTRFHVNETKTYVRGDAVPVTPTYRPPEFDIHNSPISQSFDIWSFGCVLLEFIAWYLGGWDLVRTFVTRRKLINPLMNNWQTDQFFEILQESPENGHEQIVSARVKREVYQFVNDLHSHSSCSESIHGLLEFIMSKMVVIELKLQHKLQNTSPVKHQHIRATSGEIVEFLQGLCKSLDSLPDSLVATPRAAQEAEIPVSIEVPGYPVGTRYADLPMNSGKIIKIADLGTAAGSEVVE